jgi:integrase/recombinase XerD
LLKCQKEQLRKKPVKNQRNGQAEILSEAQVTLLLAELSPKMRATFAICYFTACRVSEALQLTADDVQGGKISFRRVTTKTNHSREVPIAPALAKILQECQLPTSGKLFGVTRQAADKALRKGCDRLAIKGVSTHSFRRTAATRLHQKGVPLRVIQKIGGWSSLQALQLYLEVSQEQVVEAIGWL